MATDTLKRISGDICKDYLGFYPTTNATKPPHIANGLFRCCTGETCNTRDVHEWIISGGRKDAVSSESIIDKYQDILQNGYHEKASDIEEFRFLLDDIFDQDNAVYPSYEFSVMTISSHWMIRNKVPSEMGIGDFLFDVLSKKLDGKRSPIIELLQKALDNDTDDITKLVKPIIAFPSEKEKRNVGDIVYKEDTEIAWDPVKQSIREGFDRLALNIQDIGEVKNSLTVLKRIVNYSIFATFLYLTNGNYAVHNGKKPPIVIDAGADLESIKKASEQTYTIAKKSVEDYFANAIKKWLEPVISANTIEECIQWIDSMIFSTVDRENNIKPALISYFESFCEEESSPMAALSRALQIVLYTFEYKNNSPSDFCRVLGVRSGLIGPKGNRAKTKRYLVNSFTLETITLSALSTDELKDGLELKDLGVRLFDAYNILIGADSEREYGILEEYNIAQATPGDLRGDLSVNAQKLADTYISLGFGKKYADGVTLIGWRL